MHLVCLDLEGVLIPEIWKGVASLTKIEALNRTTRDEPDYDVLMNYRLDILNKHQIGMNEIRQVIAGMEPLEGAIPFMQWLQKQTQVIILSDTFFEFAQPLLQKIGNPTIFCHSLDIEPSGRIADYELRQPDQKRLAVKGLREMNFDVIAAGDSYNDLSMLEAANHGILFRPPVAIEEAYPHYPVTQTHQELADALNLLLKSEPYSG
jgi:phosphoserine / homoserine phosphotransferase